MKGWPREYLYAYAPIVGIFAMSRCAAVMRCRGSLISVLSLGREVDSIIRDLVDMAIKMTREEALQRVQTRAEDAAEERVLDLLLPPARGANEKEADEGAGRQRLRKLLREGNLDDKEVEVEVAPPNVGIEIMAPPAICRTGERRSLFRCLARYRSSASHWRNGFAEILWSLMQR